MSKVSMSREPLAAAILFLFVTATTPSSASPGPFCTGDCSGDGVVTVDEVVRLVSAVLEGGIADCSQGDANQDRKITVNEVVAAVTKVLNGCEIFVPGADLARQFSQRVNLVGEQPVALAVADIDCDGRVDVATVGTQVDAVSILVQHRRGAFFGDKSVEIGRGPIDVHAAVLGAAGTAAFLVANSASDALTVTSYARGAFTTASFETGERPLAIESADLDGDSLTDVVVGNADSDDLSVFRGTEEGGFAPATRVDLNASPSALAVGDWNGDQTPDVFVALPTRLAFLRGLGGGDLAPPVSVDVGTAAQGLRRANLNGDELDDLIILGVSGEAGADAIIVALLGRGDGSFEETARLNPGAAAATITVADIDGDGTDDVVSGNQGTVSVFFGRGDGSFLREIELRTEAAVSAVEVADVDGDGLRDLVYTAPLHNAVLVFWATGDRAFASTRSFPTGGVLPDRILSVDVDGDGLPDLATLNRGSDDVSILRSLGDGELADPTVVAVPAQLLAFAFGKFDDDGIPDLVAGYENRQCSDCIDVFRGVGDGRFDVSGTLPARPRILSLAAARLDTDAVDDLIVLTSDGVSVSIGLGGLMFAPAEHFAVGSDPSAMVVADLNADGLDDVATVSGESVSVWLATGSGTLSPRWEMPVAAGFVFIDAADLDLDGTVDLIFARNGSLGLLFGGGDGRFALANLGFPLGPALGPGSDLVDVNRDGRVDLVSISGGLLIYPGTEAGSVFSTGQLIVSHSLAVQAIVTDLSADGVPDVATVNAGLEGSVSVMLGLAP